MRGELAEFAAEEAELVLCHKAAEHIRETQEGLVGTSLYAKLASGGEAVQLRELLGY